VARADDLALPHGLPDQPTSLDWTAVLGRLLDEQAQILVLGGFSQVTRSSATGQPLARPRQAGGHRDLVVRKPREREGVAIQPLAGELVADVVEALQVALVAGVDAHQRGLVGFGGSGQPAHRVVADLTAPAAHQQAVGSDPREVLLVGEVENAEAVGVFESGDQLCLGSLVFLAGRAIATGAADDGRAKVDGGDARVLELHAQEGTQDGHAVIAVRNGHLSLLDATEAT